MAGLLDCLTGCFRGGDHEPPHELGARPPGGAVPPHDGFAEAMERQVRDAAGASATPAAALAVGGPVGKALGSERSELFHPGHGTFTIERQPKAANDRAMRFDMTLDRGGPDRPVRTTQHIYVDDRDPEVDGRSSIGYGDIDLPEAMQNKGLGYALHQQMARGALALGVEHLTAGSVVNPNLARLCEGIRMDPIGPASYAGRPAEVAEAAGRRAAGKGWMPIALGSRRTVPGWEVPGGRHSERASGERAGR